MSVKRTVEDGADGDEVKDSKQVLWNQKGEERCMIH